MARVFIVGVICFIINKSFKLIPNNQNDIYFEFFVKTSLKYFVLGFSIVTIIPVLFNKLRLD